MHNLREYLKELRNRKKLMKAYRYLATDLQEILSADWVARSFVLVATWRNL